MDVPAMHYVGCGFNWLFVLVSLTGYVYIMNKTGKKWSFLVIFAAAWAISGFSYIFLINGVDAGEWYITLLRVITYVLFLSTLVTSFVELIKFKNNRGA
jgi:hypothetical protein